MERGAWTDIEEGSHARYVPIVTANAYSREHQYLPHPLPLYHHHHHHHHPHIKAAQTHRDCRHDHSDEEKREVDEGEYPHRVHVSHIVLKSEGHVYSSKSSQGSDVSANPWQVKSVYGMNAQTSNSQSSRRDVSCAQCKRGATSHTVRLTIAFSCIQT